jgi:hypothetical protein
MNECVKTGFNFRIIETGENYTGDLFYYGDAPDGLFQIRGIPKVQQNPQVPLHAWVVNVVLCQRKDSDWQDTNSGVSIVNPSWAFKEHIRQWYPELIGVIPGTHDTTA